MAKIHNNAQKFPIQWDGDVTQVGKDQQNDNIPARVDVTWNAGRPITPYVACWDDGNGGVDGSQCTANVNSYFFEDFDINDKASPLSAPFWFKCFNYEEIQSDIDKGVLKAYLAEENETPGIDRYIAISKNGLGYEWRQLNEIFNK